MILELSYKLMVHGKIHRKCVKGIWRKIAQSDAFALCKRMVGIHRADYLILHDYDLAQIVGQHRMHTYRYVHHTVQNHAFKLSCTVFVNFHGNIGEEGAFVQTTPAFGGSLLAHIAIPELRPQMVTVRAHVFDALEPDHSRKGEIIVETVDVEADSDYEVLSVQEKVKNGVAIHEAEVLVAGGRGIKKEEDLDELRELANLIGGEIACSRPLVDDGWLDHSLQIGQSGTTVKPKFILNVGISGSTQYVVGMEKAQTIATINTYGGAELFDVSQYGVVADYAAIIPAIIEEIKARKES